MYQQSQQSPTPTEAGVHGYGGLTRLLYELWIPTDQHTAGTNTCYQSEMKDEAIGPNRHYYAFPSRMSCNFYGYSRKNSTNPMQSV